MGSLASGPSEQAVSTVKQIANSAATKARYLIVNLKYAKLIFDTPPCKERQIL
ncbi:hypothetical protein PL9631_1130020 [Planktothrix paucivesiculata PCC 9631]|uniref:Uncharacterized protein n=1 Tax=Planktothrix paucivesiculata PCC 9631 TaxID=671071 RepID=A0A7Z9BJ38_9CYAN|nr:hypothetical protein PL9631_1130020 [Planktothrix paucivesiculata PCC 9631]